MTKKGYILTGIVFILLAFLAMPAEAQLARQAGTVYDTQGNPVAGASVTLERVDKSGSGRSSLTTTTDADGNYAFTNMGPGKWQMSVTAEGFAPYMTVLDISAINRNPNFDVTLQPGTPLEAEDAQAEAKKVIKEADKLVAEGKYDEAIAAYKQLAEKFPAIEGSVALYVGQTYETKGDMEKAKEYYQKALEADPNSFIALKKLGDMAVADYDYETAMKHYEKILATKTDDPALFYTGGEIALSVGNNEKAVEYFSTFLEGGKDASLIVNAHMQLGFTLSVLGQNEEAIKHLEKVIELAPDFPYAAEIKAEIERLKAAS
jgi:tetratricopeptide (TPR) repeat protein